MSADHGTPQGAVPDVGTAAAGPLGPAQASTSSADAPASAWAAPSPTHRLRLLRRAKTVAILGASAKSSRASYFVATYLLSSSDYEVWFVNPNETEILGHPCYPSLAALPGVPDIVDVFRRPADLGQVLEETLAVGSPVLWLQLGLSDDEVARRGSAAGIDVVMNRCLKIEHARFHGGLHMAGFDTGVISARRHTIR